MAALDRRMDSDLIESDRITCAGRRGLSPLMTFPRRSSELLSLFACSNPPVSGSIVGMSKSTIPPSRSPQNKVCSPSTRCAAARTASSRAHETVQEDDRMEGRHGFCVGSDDSATHTIFTDSVDSDTQLCRKDHLFAQVRLKKKIPTSKGDNCCYNAIAVAWEFQQNPMDN